MSESSTKAGESRYRYEGSLAGQEVNPRNQFRSPPRKQERVDTDRKSRRIGYEGSLVAQEVNPRNQFWSPPGKQEREDIGYEGSLAGQEMNPRNQFRSPPRKQERVREREREEKKRLA